MSLRIWSESSTGVVDPEGQYEFHLTVRRDDGTAAAGENLKVKTAPAGNVRLGERSVRTDASGRAKVVLRAGAGWSFSPWRGSRQAWSGLV